MSNITVVIFEDNSSLRRGLTILINSSDGFECSGAFGNCDNLVQHIAATKPDVVLMDIEMPGMNGIEAVKILKSQFPELKILMETIFEDDEKVFHSICSGAEGYILKNTPPLQILEAIREIHEGGAPMSPGIAGKVLAMFNQGTSLTKGASHDLTLNETEMLKYLVYGMSYSVIAEKCFVSLETVRTRVKNIYKKLKVG